MGKSVVLNMRKNFNNHFIPDKKFFCLLATKGYTTDSLKKVNNFFTFLKELSIFGFVGMPFLVNI